MLQQKASKRGKTALGGGPADLISELPVNVIDVILELLPVRDAARMSVLSHKWFDFWRSIQKLAFDAQFFSSLVKAAKRHDTHGISRIVTNILFYHSGNLSKFHLYIPALKSCPDIDPWICYLSRAGVSDISIQNQSKVDFKLRSIFSCDHLEKLMLHRVRIKPPRNFGGFRKMKCLELENITITGTSFNRLIKNCPLLQKLRLTNCVGIYRIVINFPNLTHLILDSVHISLDVRNAENLVSAVFGLHNWHEAAASHSTCSRVFIKDLANSRKLENLVLKGQYCKLFCEERLLPPAFDKLRELELSSIYLNNTDEFYSIINFIQSCPAIERLHISVTESKHPMSDTVDYNPDVVLHRLCYADVSICSGSLMELKLIEMLLACSPVLNKLSITTSGNRKKVFQTKFTNQLNRFRRASGKAEVICADSCLKLQRGW
ncbi:F-box/FBD/LRR-repeat protein At1g13570-like [Silene latifolia]|uniref:F-box/FBD/LRR-repeat protein At1g13570-like n=1 Tax=Silene latifolia TaxID=37657 RepID=UPI003D77252C